MEQYFITYLNILEGYKTRIKNLHWAAPNLNIHKELDDFLEIISNYQDSIAEGFMGIHRQISHSEILGDVIKESDPLILLKSILEKTLQFYKGLENNSLYIGIRSEVETFIFNINKYTYLFTIC